MPGREPLKSVSRASAVCTSGGTFSFNGFGTTLYGNREQGPDGSYVATEWVVFLWLPVYPLRSWRILPTGRSTTAVVYNFYGYQRATLAVAGDRVRACDMATGQLRAFALAHLELLAPDAQVASYDPTQLPAPEDTRNVGEWFADYRAELEQLG